MSDAFRPCVLITRPEAGARQTSDRVARLGFRPILAPMLTIRPHALSLPGPAPQAILITSANALAALPDFVRGTRLLAVGDATAELARAAGFTEVESAGRDAAALALLTLQRCRPEDGPLLLVSGAGQGLALARTLRGHGFTVQRRVAYRSVPVRALPPDAAAALAEGQVRAALFFSAATAHSFVACMTERKQDVTAVEALAISPPTVLALSPLPWRRIRVASHPNQDELVALLS